MIDVGKNTADPDKKKIGIFDLTHLFTTGQKNKYFLFFMILDERPKKINFIV